VRILFVCSSGGHLAQLSAIDSWWREHERRWVTNDTADARAALEGETIAWGHFPTTRNVPNTLRNFALARKLLRDWKPDVVMSTGAGIALPFFVIGRLMGVRTVYLEVYDRIDSSTLTGRLVQRWTDVFMVQWERQLENYPEGAVVVGPVW
jgi:UDP-N-acetylglucosamine:LPS N-acetylglucosamine transferase